MRDLLAADKGVNLRQSLRGPKELHGLQSNEPWIYTFKNLGAGDESAELSQPFQNLGLAVLADC